MTYREFNTGELRAFFIALDRRLGAEERLVLIGGSAAMLGHGVFSVTQDVDTFHAPSPALCSAAAAVSVDTGLNIPIQPTAVADVPWHYEDRLVRVLPELQMLRLFVLDRHDLALSKIVRWTEADEAHVTALAGLELETLLSRFKSEMSHVIGDPGRLRDNFLDMIEAVFGELKRVGVERQLTSPAGTL